MPAPRPAPELLDFDRYERGPIVAVMRRLLRDRDGWLNLAPDVDPEEVPDASAAVGRLFTSRGPTVPLATWVPGARKRSGAVEALSIGLQHGGGPKAIRKLRDGGLAVPDGWRLLADHPRRGIVAEVPDEQDPDVALDWLLDAATRLTPFVLPTRWHAGVFASRA